MVAADPTEVPPQVVDSDNSAFTQSFIMSQTSVGRNTGRCLSVYLSVCLSVACRLLYLTPRVTVTAVLFHAPMTIWQVGAIIIFLKLDCFLLIAEYLC